MKNCGASRTMMKVPLNLKNESKNKIIYHSKWINIVAVNNPEMMLRKVKNRKSVNKVKNIYHQKLPQQRENQPKNNQNSWNLFNFFYIHQISWFLYGMHRIDSKESWGFRSTANLLNLLHGEERSTTNCFIYESLDTEPHSVVNSPQAAISVDKKRRTAAAFTHLSWCLWIKYQLENVCFLFASILRFSAAR